MARGDLANAIRGLLRDVGPMTSYDLLQGLVQESPDLPRDRLTSVTSRLHRKQGEIHIKSWQRENPDGQQFYPRPVYALGPGKDAPKPKALTAGQYNARRPKLKDKPVASIFHLASHLAPRAAAHVRKTLKEAA